VTPASPISGLFHDHGGELGEGLKKQQAQVERRTILLLVTFYGHVTTEEEKGKGTIDWNHSTLF
jgi:hypothetical protein